LASPRLEPATEAAVPDIFFLHILYELAPYLIAPISALAVSAPALISSLKEYNPHNQQERTNRRINRNSSC